VVGVLVRVVVEVVWYRLLIFAYYYSYCSFLIVWELYYESFI